MSRTIDEAAAWRGAEIRERRHVIAFLLWFALNHDQEMTNQEVAWAGSRGFDRATVMCVLELKLNAAGAWRSRQFNCAAEGARLFASLTEAHF